jgi:hypothetical protein
MHRMTNSNESRQKFFRLDSSAQIRKMPKAGGATFDPIFRDSVPLAPPALQGSLTSVGKSGAGLFYRSCEWEPNGMMKNSSILVPVTNSLSHTGPG